MDFNLIYTLFVLSLIGFSYFIYSDFSSGVIRIYFISVTLLTFAGIVGVFLYLEKIVNFFFWNFGF